MVKIKGEVRYPSRGDKFFVDKGDPDEIAWLHKTFQEFGSYADSYQTGALTILDSAIANPDLRDFNIYPAVFLIRHYLELRLKELKQGLNYCIEQKRNFPTGHDLQHLWSEFQRGYEQLTDEIDKDRFEIISELITEINNVDPISPKQVFSKKMHLLLELRICSYLNNYSIR